VVQPLSEHEISFDLRAAVREAAKLQPIDVPEAVQTQILDFIAGRLSVVLKEKGYRYDVVEAVLAEQSADPARAASGEAAPGVGRAGRLGHDPAGIRKMCEDHPGSAGGR
jgi:glycyl-tRNA synthetase beta subunit